MNASTSQGRPETPRELVIEAGRTEGRYWRDLWHYRELFQVLAARDISVRYKQTVIGAVWAIARPALTLIVFTLVFGKLARLPSDGSAPYPLMVFAGMLPWMFFAGAVSDASNSLVGNANLISKVYFPRLIVPIAAIMVSMVDFLVSFLILVGLLVWYKFALSFYILLLPIFMAMALLASLGLGFWIASLNVKYRDFRHIVPVMLQLGLYASPVGYSSAIIPDQWRPIFSLNPMVGVIDGFRWSILGSQSPPYLPGMAISLVVAVILLWYGLRQFRRTEKAFADLI